MGMKILFLFVNPPSLDTPLRLDEEARAIDQVLRRSETGRSFDIAQGHAVRVNDLQELLLRHSPQIVHFSGHGLSKDGLVFQDEYGNPQVVPPQALTKLFSILKGDIRCVLLNACFSVDQAEGIAEYIDYVIGMNTRIDDKASINFASAFYQALGYAQDIETAFELGKNQLAIHGLEDVRVPELFTKRDGFGIYSNSTTDANIESPYGTMSPGSRFYIEREADVRCSQVFASNNPFTMYIQAPRQVGKSSLMQRITHYARLSAGTKTAFVDFERFTQKQFGDLESFLIDLCLMIGDELGIEEEIDRYFGSKRRSNLVKCSNYLSKHIMPSLQGPIVLAMDEVERVLGTTFQNDFFGMLRTWHNDRARDPSFARISLFLSSSTEPELFIDNPNQSPFNVAQHVTLSDFGQLEVQQLNKLHASPLNHTQVQQVITLLGGHPFLTRLFLYLIATRQASFDVLLAQATADDGPFGHHLSYFWRHLAKTPDLQASLRQIQRSQQHPADRNLEKLKGAGLVKRSEGKIVIRNELYARYFKERING